MATTADNRVLRGGVIGCGFFAANHLHGWQDVEGATIVAVCDRERARAVEAAGRFGVPAVYDDASAMFEAESLDFVDIVTTVESHRPLVELACRYRVPAICQKPLALTADDAAAMVDAATAAGITFMVHENFRFERPLMAVREKLDAGAIGRAHWGHISFRHGYDVYAGQPYLLKEKRLAVMDVGVHVLDIARYYFGEAVRIYCAAQRIDPRVTGEDCVTMLLTHESGAVSVVDISFATRIDPDPFPQTLVRIEGADGTLELDGHYRLSDSGPGRRRVEDVEPPGPNWATPPWHVVQDSVIAAQQHWVNCLSAGQEPATSGRDNLKTLKLVFAAYESIETGRAVDL
jgi:predicted dehydrogenase